MTFPAEVLVLDLSSGQPIPQYEYAIGRYDERRPGIYTTELFNPGMGAGNAASRDLHVGIDLFGPVGTPLRSFADGKIHLRAYNAAAGDYGYTVITEHDWHGRTLYALWGHLAARSVTEREPGTRISTGETIAWIGDRDENGGWPPHLHFQLSWEPPRECDLPGVVMAQNREAALRLYPDPRMVLGPIY